MKICISGNQINNVDCMAVIVRYNLPVCVYIFNKAFREVGREENSSEKVGCDEKIWKTLPLCVHSA